MGHVGDLLTQRPGTGLLDSLTAQILSGPRTGLAALRRFKARAAVVRREEETFISSTTLRDSAKPELSLPSVLSQDLSTSAAELGVLSLNLSFDISIRIALLELMCLN